MSARLDWLISAPLIDAASGLWLAGHALPVLALAAFLLLAALTAPRLLRFAVLRVLPTRTPRTRAARISARPCRPTAPPLRGAVAARAPGRGVRALPRLP